MQQRQELDLTYCGAVCPAQGVRGGGREAPYMKYASIYDSFTITVLMR